MLEATLVLVFVGGFGMACAPRNAVGVAAGGPIASAPPPGPPTPSPVAGPALRVTAGEVVLSDGRRVPFDSSALRKVDALFDILKSDGSPFRNHEEYALDLAPSVPARGVLSVFQTAAFAGWSEAALANVGSKVVLFAKVPGPIAKAQMPLFPERPLAVVIRREKVELWRVARSDLTDSAPTSVAALPLNNVHAGLPHLVQTECTPQAPCNPIVLFTEHEAPSDEFVLVLEQLALALNASRDQPLRAQLYITEPPKESVAPDVRVGATDVSGRLAPELIQKVFRAQYDRMRQCYVDGLGRDPNLRGRVELRFVIGRSGEVTRAFAGDRTNLPDKIAVDCVVRVLAEGTTFPKPEGGIVTVVYPVNFEPSDK